MTILKIIPQIKLPRNIEGIFDYSACNTATSINKGQLCLIPFRNKNILGICLEAIEQKTSLLSKKILPIKKIIEIIPPLPKYYLKLIKWLREEYFVSLSSLIYYSLPSLPAKFIFNNNLNNTIYYNKQEKSIGKNYPFLKIPRNEIIYIKNFLTAIKNSSNNFLFISPNQLIKNYYLDCILYIKIIEWYFKNQFPLECEFHKIRLQRSDQIQSNKKNNLNRQQSPQILILCPTIVRLKEFLNYLPPTWQNKIAILDSEIYQNKNLYWQNFLKIINNQTRIIIGTRSAVLMPYANLKIIIIDQAESSDYKQVDRNPRYDARKIAYKLSKLCKAKLVFSSLAYRTEDCFAKEKIKSSPI